MPMPKWHVPHVCNSVSQSASWKVNHHVFFILLEPSCPVLFFFLCHSYMISRLRVCLFEILMAAKGTIWLPNTFLSKGARELLSLKGCFGGYTI